jgi:hypothetical protein
MCDPSINAECRVLFIVMLSVDMQNVVMLNVVAPLVVMSTGCWQLHEIVFIRKRFILLNVATTVSIMTFSITTLSITTFNAYAECRYAESLLSCLSKLTLVC